MTMKANILKTDGSSAEQVELPPVFTEEYRPDLIKRAFIAELSRKIQPWGANPLAGMRRIAESWDVGGGRARLPRAKAGPHRGGRARGHRYRSKGRWFAAAGRALVVPGTVFGREAHPPKPEKVLAEKINKNEQRKAIKSAIAATANRELVEKRGHLIENIKAVPLIVDDSICDLKKTKEIVKALNSFGLEKELVRANKAKQRSGKGKKRGRRLRKKTSALVIVPKEKSGARKLFRNIRGVDVATAEQLDISLLAPGAGAGRLAIWTKTALREVQERFEAK